MINVKNDRGDANGNGASGDPRRGRTALDLEKQVLRIVARNSRYDMAYGLLDDALAGARAGREGRCYVIQGVTGVGKTTVLDVFMRERGKPRFTEEGLRRDVLRVDMPDQVGLSEFYAEVLEALGAEDLASRNLPAMKRAVRAQLRLQGVSLLIVDEFTHIVEDKSRDFTRRVVRELKRYLSKRLCDIVFVGTEQAIEIIDMYAQIRRRLGVGEMTMPAFDFQDDDDKAEWMTWLGEVAGGLPIPLDESPAASGRLAGQIHHACDGTPSPAIKLLALATKQAHRVGDDAIRQSHLWYAFEDGGALFQPDRGTRKRNPFDKPDDRGKPKPAQAAPTYDPAVDGPTNLYVRGPKPGPKATFTKR